MSVRRWGAILGAVLLVLAAALVWSPRGGKASMGEAKSALRRTILGKNNTAPVAYWPLEDPDGSTFAASGLLGGRPLEVGATAPTFGKDICDGAVSGAEFADQGTLAASVSSAATTAWTVSFVGSFVTPDTTAISILRVEAGDLHATVSLSFFSASVITGQEGASGILLNTASTNVSDNNEGDRLPYVIALTAEQDGSDVDFGIYVDGVLIDSDTMTGITLSRVTRIQLGDGLPTFAGTSVYMGQVAIYDSVFATAYTDAVKAYVGETATARITRLCAEEAIAVDVAS